MTDRRRARVAISVGLVALLAVLIVACVVYARLYDSPILGPDGGRP